MIKPHINQIVECNIHDLGVSGEGVGKWNGYTLFIDGALPGEVVRVKLVQCNKTYGRAKLLSILKPSSARVAPICPHYDRCGGCQLMHFSYADQLEFKRQRVLKAMLHIAKLSDVIVEPCIASPETLGYRNKIQLIASTGNCGLTLGLFERHSHDVVEIDKCFIHCPLGEEIFHTIKSILIKESFGKGVLRHLLIKTAVNTKQCLVVLVTRDCDHDSLQKAAQDILLSHSSIKGVVQNINRREDNVILGDEYRLLAGQDHIMEDLNGLSFKLSPASFFQVNPAQALHLYDKAIEFGELSPSDNALDFYCGVGTLTLHIARHCQHVIGVESVPEAIKDAEENGERNNISNAEFRCADVGSFLKGFDKKIDVVFLNPPRKGCDPSVLESLSHLRPDRIVYISCDPATLARDVALLCHYGYAVSAFQPFDMFPQTAHVETIVKLIMDKRL